jgi:hypothetical protein
MAPFLAVVMALLIAGAVAVFLPLNQPDQTKSVSITSAQIPQPTQAPNAVATASAADLYTLPFIIMLTLAAVIVGVAVVLLFFRKEPQ